MALNCWDKKNNKRVILKKFFDKKNYLRESFIYKKLIKNRNNIQ